MFLSLLPGQDLFAKSLGAGCVGESDTLRDNSDHHHSVSMLQPRLAFTKVDSGAQSGQSCLHLRHAVHLELLHGEGTPLHLPLLIPTRQPRVLCLVEEDAWDLALLRLLHSSQFLVVQVELCLHGSAGDNLVLLRDGSTQSGERRGTLRHPLLLELGDAEVRIT